MASLARPRRQRLDLFRANSEVYLDAASTNPSYRQIVLIDGPAVLGWKHLVRTRRTVPPSKIAGYLRGAVAEGVLEPQPVEPLAHLLSALGVGSALYVAHADDPEEARREISECNERFLSALGVVAARGRPRTLTTRTTRPHGRLRTSGLQTSRLRQAEQREGTDHGLGFLHRARVPGEAGLGAPVRSATGSSHSTSSTPTSSSTLWTDELRQIVDPMKQEVRDHDLWAAHLGPELGGKGYGQVKLALLNEILGVSGWAPIVFGTQAPDTGNAEIIAHYGTDGAEGAVPPAAARRGVLLVLLDDRAPGGFGPPAVHHPGGEGR